ncbi:MAG: hypothetical protein KDD44_06815, partial [Bdellovibrionales bacterium]|nr:hypothetical protein [Bdellovibrionales bacterium]
TLGVSQLHLTTLRLREHPADLVVRPAVGPIGLLDFHRGPEGIEAGEQAAEEALPQLRALLESIRGRTPTPA